MSVWASFDVSVSVFNIICSKSFNSVVGKCQSYNFWAANLDVIAQNWYGPRQANLVLIAYASSESRGTFRQKARSLAPLNGWACAVKICHDGILEDTNSLDGAHIKIQDSRLKKDMQEKESIMVAWRRLRILSQASWCQTFTIMTEFSICTSQPLIIVLIWVKYYTGTCILRKLYSENEPSRGSKHVEI